MAVFEYQGLDSKGKEVRGIVDADSDRLAREKLRGAGVYPTTLTIEKKRFHIKASLLSLKGQGARVKQADLSAFYRQLATLLGAGVPLIESISGVVEQADNLRLKKPLTSLREKINEGSSFADAAIGYPNLFPELFVNMIAVGETSGTLDIVLSRLADISEENLRLQNKVQGALFYPILMAMLGSGIMFFLMTFVIPRVTEVFNDFHTALPLPTQILLFTSGFLRKYWILIAVAIIAILFFVRRYFKTAKGRRKFDSASLKVPFFGMILRLTAVSRFARTLSILLTSGVPLLKSMEIVGKVVNNKIMSEAIEDARIRIGEGGSLSAPLKESGLFPGTLIQMISVGEKSGNIEGMLGKAADSFDYQIDNAISGLTSIIEPVIIVIMGGMIGFIVISILLPIFEMSQLVK